MPQPQYQPMPIMQSQCHPSPMQMQHFAIPPMPQLQYFPQQSAMQMPHEKCVPPQISYQPSLQRHQCPPGCHPTQQGFASAPRNKRIHS